MAKKTAHTDIGHTGLGGNLGAGVELLHEGGEVVHAARGLFGRRAAKAAAREVGALGASEIAAATPTLTAPPIRRSAMLVGATGATAGLSGAFGFFTRINKLVFGAGMAAAAVASLSGGKADGGQKGMFGKLLGARKAALDGATPVVETDAALGVIGKVAQVVGAPERILKETTANDLSHALSGGLSKAAKLTGKSPAMAGALSRASEGAGAAEKIVFGAVGQGADRLSKGLGDLVEAHGGSALKGFAGRASATAAKHHDKAGGLVSEMLSQIGGNETLSGAKGHLELAQQALKAKDTTKFSEALNAAREAIGSAGKGEVGKKTLAGLNKAMGGAAEAVSAASQKEGLAAKLGNMPDMIRKAPENFGKASISNIALKGALVTGNALQVTATVKGISEKTHVLKQVYSDMTGETRVSTRKLMFSRNVPPLVKELRGQIIKEYGPRMVLNMANTVATYTFMKGNNLKSMLGSAGLNIATSLHSAKVQGYAVLPLYQQMNQASEISDVQYAQFITAASKDAAAAGGMESPLVQALAVDYAKEGIRPGELLKEIQSGKFDERALAKVRESQQVQTTRSQGADREILGEHTQRAAMRQQAKMQEPIGVGR